MSQDAVELKTGIRNEGSFLFDFIACAVFTALAMLAASWNLGPTQSNFIHVGAEYFRIAQSLARGDGFSDPFPVATGPTAWMPPLIPFLLAPAIRFMGVSGAVVIFVIAQAALIAASFAMLLQFARRRNLLHLAFVVLPIMALANAAELFCYTHDTALLLFLTTGLCLAFVRLIDRSHLVTMVDASRWGLFGGVLAYASPALAATWAILTAFGWRRNVRALIIAAAISMVVVTPWCIRNYQVFGHLIPIKSNAGFDAWQANVDDQDGLIDYANSLRHPSNTDGEHIVALKELGEYQYNRRLSQEFKSWVVAHPFEYFGKCFQRFVASMAWHSHSRPLNHPVWYGFPAAVSFVWCLLIVVGIWMGAGRAVEFQVALALQFAYLLPYWLITYYERYGAALVGIKAWLAILALEAIMIRVRQTRMATNRCGLHRLAKSNTPN